MQLGSVAPLLGLAFGFVTLIGTYLMSSYYKHLPVDLKVPFISLNGVKFPEYALYSAGFTTTGICIFSSALFARKNLFPMVESELQAYAEVSFWSASVASMGLCVQAIVPLQVDILDVIAGTVPLSTQSIVHQTAALVLFLSGYVHCITMDILLWKSRSLPNNSAARWLKTALTVTAISPFVISFMPHPASGGSGNLDEMTDGAIGQWICVSSLLFYFASYQIEFSSIRNSANIMKNKSEGDDTSLLLTASSELSVARPNAE